MEKTKDCGESGVSEHEWRLIRLSPAIEVIEAYFEKELPDLHPKGGIALDILDALQTLDVGPRMAAMGMTRTRTWKSGEAIYVEASMRTENDEIVSG